MKKIAIIGAGVSGLSCAQLLQCKGHEVTVYERQQSPGGIARSRMVEGTPFHITGGHCFNSKYEEVRKFVFSFLPESEWNLVTRNAKIFFKGHEISYPIELSLQEISRKIGPIAKIYLRDFIQAQSKYKKSSNLAEWFSHGFGESLAQDYFIPYNQKIWNRSPYEMDFDWVKEKLPNPDLDLVIKSLFEDAYDAMPHKYFYYPKTGGIETLINKMAIGININYSKNISQIKKDERLWIVNGLKYDSVISTAPLDQIVYFLPDVPQEIMSAAKKLKYNKVTTMLWKSDLSPQTWTYIPEKKYLCHRHIHIGNFFQPAQNRVITEAIGDVSYEDMESDGRQFPYLKRPLDYHVSNHAYVVFDKYYKKNRSQILKFLGDQGIYSIGRFAEWEYYNMDICIKSAMEMASEYN